MFISMSIVLCFLLLTGIILTFVLKTKQSNLNSQNTENIQLEQEYKNLKEQNDYKNSNQYADDYFQYEQGYGNQGDIIIEVK